jgi:D-alanyl-D-alanine carboxypeptidase/D-alanyl-D-alanine-endopeptidase (penicillin-binding protein 4)
MKLVTAAAASDAVGWQYAFDTTFEITGHIDRGVLRGDLRIRGTGDPSLLGRGGTDFIDSLVGALHERGIRIIEGRIIGDDKLVEEPRPGRAWSWDDLGTPSGTLSGALNILENAMGVVVTPGSSQGLPTRIDVPPEIADVTIVNLSSTGALGSVQTLVAEQRPRTTELIIAGSIAAAALPATLIVAAGNPTEWFVRVVHFLLKQRGIDVRGVPMSVNALTGTQTGGRVIIHHQSHPLADIVKPMLKFSINMYADSLFRLATGPDGPRATPAAIQATRKRLSSWGIQDEALQIADGSGLSRHSVVAAEALVAILRKFHQPASASPFVQALPVAGRDGTLLNRMKGTRAEGNVLAKTGSMTNVRSLAGYVTTHDKEVAAFAIIANNFATSPKVVTDVIDQIMVLLASFSRKANS